MSRSGVCCQIARYEQNWCGLAHLGGQVWTSKALLFIAIHSLCFWRQYWLDVTIEFSLSNREPHGKLRKLYFYFLSNWMGYDRSDSFSLQEEFYLVQHRKENCYHDYIPFNLKGNRSIVFSVYVTVERYSLRSTLRHSTPALRSHFLKNSNSLVVGEKPPEPMKTNPQNQQKLIWYFIKALGLKPNIT